MALYYGPPSENVNDLLFSTRIDVLGNKTIVPKTVSSFPIIRKTFLDLHINDLVSVQPMTIPTGHIFHYSYSYSSPISLKYIVQKIILKHEAAKV